MIVNYFFLLIILLISIVSPLNGNSISGSILASKYSSSINDFQKSADFNLKILESGVDDPAFYNDALLYLVASGNFNASFKLSKKNERIGRNPKTKEEFLISERKSIRFIVSKNLSKVLNLYNE